ncbi:acyl-CoA carboxylase epsilon subunit [Brachybacterium squillarum]|uniref:acyl-CoA carboxylase epsilon subunit n=1 Tax=Brachybacterium squillarum TaxID=661979 RepID=UPI00222176D8|nr:acyl-CoA carboxylase epsilon subunit [Brachybacterium squillarum]MCW1804825.1 hypothetical protein [Brachybacterium squillarum]
MSTESPAAEGGPDGRSDVRLVSGRLEADELAAIAVVVSAMSVTSRLEAEERSLDGGPVQESAWTSPVHTHARGHRERHHPSASAWVFADR